MSTSSSYSAGGDHCWLVAKKDNFDPEDGGGARTVYVVSIAGTSGIKNWREDFAVRNVVDADSWLASWGTGSIQPPSPYGRKNPDPNTSWIARGTATGAYILATTTGNGPNGPQETLLNYLRAEATKKPDATFIVVGHSLGGALTPVVAMGLQNILKAKLLAFPMAGPTPGNTKFKQQYTEAFKPISTSQGSAQKLNINFCNTQDIVPMAWDTLDDITKLYTLEKTGWALHAQIVAEVASAKNAAEASGIVWSPLAKTMFTSSPITTEKTWAKLRDKNIAPQHVAEYLKLFGFPGLLNAKDQMMIGFAGLGLMLGGGVLSMDDEGREEEGKDEKGQDEM